MADALKIADLAMLSLTEAESLRFQKDMEEILAAGESMPAADSAASPFRAASLDALRDDTACPAEGRGLLSLSEKERDGYIVVTRTVGGSV